ncbi:hypothetical protein OK074_2833 [Actinobacteria bacterium OK074]|nr:hypothetical protein OK074_2833 [Actinobacteria bacterium OK074]
MNPTASVSGVVHLGGLVIETNRFAASNAWGCRMPEWSRRTFCSVVL